MTINCKAVYHLPKSEPKFGPVFGPIFGLVTLLIISLVMAPASAHEIRPAVADFSIISSNDDNKAKQTLQISIDFSAEIFLARLDASQIKDTDDAIQGPDYDRLRASPPDKLAAQFTAAWPKFSAILNGYAGANALTFVLQRISVEDTLSPPLAVTLPRSTKIIITADLPDDNSPISFGWNARLGALVLRQQNPNIDQDKLYTGYLTPGMQSPPIARLGTTVQTITDIVTAYVKIGFVHIVPKGLDHILFVLGLFFYAANWRPLLAQVTVFTLAHTITLALASTGIIVVSAAIIEPLIAASIIYVAVENLRNQRLGFTRMAVIFGFGLLHGLGFASVLADIGMAPGDFALSLISFNIGVELGQIAVLLPIFLLVWLLPINLTWYRRFIALPASSIIGIIGLWMLVSRILGG